MRTIILITGHYLHSHRRAGFHWLADALHRRGWRVIMMTTPISWLSWLNRDHRMKYDVRSKAGRIIWDSERLGSYVWWTRVHPVSLKYAPLDRLARVVFDRFARQPLGEIESEIRSADCFIFESTSALVLADRFRRLNDRARMVYRVSDDLSTLRVPPSLHEQEMQLAELFNCISSPTETIHSKFSRLQTAQLDRHGVPTELFARCQKSPYDVGRTTAVFTGVARFDHWFVDVVSNARRDVDFHIIGPIERKPQRRNVIYHGELPFEDTVPFVKFADVGLQTITGGSGAESFADSLKMMQYSWCLLPIVAPDFVGRARPNIISYTPGDDLGAVRSLESALQMERQDTWRAGIQSWGEVAGALLGALAESDVQKEPTIETLVDHVRVSSAS